MECNYLTGDSVFESERIRSLVEHKREEIVEANLTGNGSRKRKMTSRGAEIAFRETGTLNFFRLLTKTYISSSKS